jgi:phytoene dehydrogenase-like protein
VTYDAVVIGAGPNGLVAANLLADRGWSVLVVEAQDDPGGAVRSGEIVRPGFVSDRFSAFYPLGYASPTIRRLRLEDHGLRWVRSRYAVAHPDADGRCAFISTRLEETKAGLDRFAPGDGAAWEALYDYYRRIGPGLLEALMTPFPPIRAALRILRGLGFSRREILRFARFGVLPVRRLAEETFEGEGGAWLLAGNALHADLTPESSAGGLFGWLLCSLGQHVGFPVPVGGASELTAAMVRRLESRGGRVECGRHVDAIVLDGGPAAGVLAGGERIAARKAVLADTSAPALYRDLLPREAVPDTVIEDVGRMQFDSPTVKVDWALGERIPWTASECAHAGTVHVSEGMDGLSAAATDLACRRVPEHPFVILGQYSMVDPTRCPAGREVAWGYTHVPPGSMTTRAEVEALADRIELEVERMAPGFRERILGRSVAGPVELEEADENLVGGAVNNGTAQLHQQLVFRPVPGLGRPETPVRGLYLAEAAAHPGGGVHGGPGGNAARAALAHDRLRPGK